ncbi:MAG: TlpA family protein disulfide reductase [Planctomycetes bacterium]|nr:TlpA family protein disulfide reductase [Planctomycetota bacterium]
MNHKLAIACILAATGCLAVSTSMGIQPAAGPAGKDKAKAPAAAAPQGDAKALALLDSARKAIADTKVISFKATLAGTGTATSTATVSLARAQVGGWKVTAKGENLMPPSHSKPAPGKKEVKDGVGIEKPANDALKATPFDIAFDGVTARSVREAEKEVIEGVIKDDAGLQNFFASQRAGGILPWEMLNVQPFQLASTTTISIDGTVEVGGVKCNVLKVETKAPPAKGGVRSHGGAVVKYAFGEQDNLLRSVERTVAPIPGAAGDAKAPGMTLTLTEFRINGAAAIGNFSPAVPDGFVVKPIGMKSNDTPEGMPAKPDQATAPTKPAKPNDAAKPGVDKSGLLAVGSDAPDWTLMDKDGNEVKLSSLRGNIVMMDFWATWCGPCKAAMPGVQKMHEKFADKNVKIYGVNMAERDDGTKARKYFADNKFTYGLLMGGDNVANQYKVRGIPTFYLIGKDGKILFSGSGFSSKTEKELETIIEKQSS